MKQLLIIGAGGIASYFFPIYMKTFHKKVFEELPIIYDGDTLEERNLDRQLFDSNQVGVNKARALLHLYCPEATYVSQYITVANAPEKHNGPIMCFADNHVARKTALSLADYYKMPLIIAANEYFDAEAFVYYPEWKKHKVLDPRVRWPEILTDQTGDPLHCQGDEALEASPQLAIANCLSASFSAGLLWQLMKQDENTPRESIPYFCCRTQWENTSVTPEEVYC